MAITDGTQFGKMSPFRFWCQKVLPAVYDDSLSYYELLCKVSDYINQLIEVTNTQSDAITELQETLAEFMAGTFDPYIEEKVDEWFNENQPSIMNAISSLQDSVSDLQLEMERAISMSTNYRNIICIGDSYGRGVGGNDDHGWPYFIESWLRCDNLLNVSNSGAGFVANGHSSPYGAINFYGQVDWAVSNLPNNLIVDDIDIVIVAGGYNDHALSGQYQAAFDLAHHIITEFPNAQVCFFPLVVGDRELNNEFMSSYQNLVLGFSEGGGQVFPDSLYWLYPEETATSNGDNIHPNNMGYRRIAGKMGGCILGGNNYGTTFSYASSNEGFQFGENAVNQSFRCGALNNFGFFGGAIKLIGDGDLCRLPTYLRPNETSYILVFGYADSTHEGVFRIRILTTGWVQVYKQETGTWDDTLEYTYWIPSTMKPLGHMLNC